ncbi:MAG: APC family permease [Acidiferrobacteraceae bacterium]
MTRPSGPSSDRGSESSGWRQRFATLITGPARDPFSPETRQHITLVAFLAWVGLGADGLSSSCYGPEEAFKALGPYTGLGLWLAVATALTVFIISIGYNQVIELLPTGGGGYKVATMLLGPRAGLVSGSALVVDYILTIAISVAAGVDALFSLVSPQWQVFKIPTEVLLLLVLLVLNLRGIKESVQFLLPIFLGFVVTHAFLIIYGIVVRLPHFHSTVPVQMHDITMLAHRTGLVFVVALFLRAYSLGGGTYTGIEAVSNNISSLKEPRVRTGKLTMFYMAASLSFVAGGIILLYLLWNVHVIPGQTLNAVAFGDILKGWHWGSIDVGQYVLWVTLALEAGLLIVAANTGFLGGPAVLANMANDYWVPRRFAQLSDRLVTRNGILVMGLSALVVLLGTHGEVGVLVVLYSINVFLTFALTLLGLTLYWWRNRATEPAWFWRALVSVPGFILTASILVVTLEEKFYEGGWVTVLVTVSLIIVGFVIERHYRRVQRRLADLDEVLTQIPEPSSHLPAPKIDKNDPTAAFFVSNYKGVGIHSLLNVQRMFPGYFKNFIFLSVGVVDNSRMKGSRNMDDLMEDTDRQLATYVGFCEAHGLPSAGRSSFGMDAVDSAVKLADETLKEYPGAVFFAGTLVFREENLWTRLLHNHTAISLQRRLHLKGVQLVIMPMLVDISR